MRKLRGTNIDKKDFYVTSKPLSAGDPIESQCTKCRTLTNHTIIALVDNLPVKVQCNTCAGQHKYRPQVKQKRTVTKRTTTPKVTKTNEWQKLTSEADDQNILEYSMTSAFKVGDLMAHPTFGLGVVQAHIGQGKIEVLFEEGIKKLRCS